MHTSACARAAVHEGRVLVGVEACPSFVTKVPGGMEGWRWGHAFASACESDS